MARIVVSVWPGAEGSSWVVKEDEARSLYTTPSKAAARAFAEQWAKDRQPSLVKVHDANGEIESEHTFPETV